MIPFFPDPYPDELLYSICARYSLRMGYPKRRSPLHELFGAKVSTAVVDLPCNLGHLITVLPSGHQYTVKKLIDDHTLLPFYSPFLPLERVSRLRKGMSGDKKSIVHNSSGIAPSSVRLPDKLRFCPLCVKEDEKQFGESYWHRIHQIAGVEVCHNHYVFLQDSQISARNRINHDQFVPASEVITTNSACLLDLTNLFDKHLIRVACDIAWLLSQHNLLPGFDSLRKRYLQLLVEHKLASKSGIIHSKKLVKALIDYYSSEFLKRLQCEVELEKPANWPQLLFIDLKVGQANHPLRHLLLMQLLGHTAEDFFQLPDELESYGKPFGDGPWPCLDLTSDHFKKQTINKFRLIHGKTDGRPIGVFRCACGHSYSRKGPDLSSEARYTYTRFLSYSQSWDTTLRELWGDSSLTVNQIRRRLGVVNHETIKRRAAQLGLPFPRFGPNGSLQIKPEKLSHIKHCQRVFQEQQETYREQWLLIRKNNPEVCRRVLRQTYMSIYDWLYRNDSEWLRANLPPRYKRVGSGRKVDWESRDLDLSAAVRAVAEQLKNAPGFPRRVTLKGIGIKLDRTALLQKERDKLPQTAQVLDEFVETYEQFAIRRIQWAAESFRQEEICPSQLQLLRKARLGAFKPLKVSEIKKAIATALQSFELPRETSSPETISTNEI